MRIASAAFLGKLNDEAVGSTTDPNAGGSGRILEGTYLITGQGNHGRPVYRRRATPAHKEEEEDAAPPLVYFWGEGAPEDQGWWFGPEIGADDVWGARC